MKRENGQIKRDKSKKGKREKRVQRNKNKNR